MKKLPHNDKDKGKNLVRKLILKIFQINLNMLYMKASRIFEETKQEEIILSFLINVLCYFILESIKKEIIITQIQGEIRGVLYWRN